MSDSRQSSSFDANADSEDGEEGEYMVRGSNCCTSFAATVEKRWNIYVRDWCGLFCQVVSPLVLIFLGILLSSGPNTVQQSPERYLSTDLYPHQHILMNDYPVNPYNDGNDVPMSEFRANLPNATDAFTVTYYNNSEY